MPAPITVAELLYQVLKELRRWPLFYGHGTDNAWDEALSMVAQAMGIWPMDLQPALYSVTVAPSAVSLVHQWLKQRCHQRMPLPYITGEADFAGIRLDVNPHVLIPRSSLAAWTMTPQHWLPESCSVKPTLRVVDLGTGSGALAIATAYYQPHWQVYAVDISAQALAIVERNIARWQLTDQVTCIHTDLTKAHPWTQQFDIVLANPPYVGGHSMNRLPKEYLHEPELALRDRQDGLYHTEHWLRNIEPALADDAYLWVELGEAACLWLQRYPDIGEWWQSPVGTEDVLVLSHDELCQWLAYVDGMEDQGLG